MDEITVTKEHMDALKALAGVNLKVSEARNSLTKLQEVGKAKSETTESLSMCSSALLPFSEAIGMNFN